MNTHTRPRTNVSTRTLRPLFCLEKSVGPRFALILLNQPLKSEYLNELWKKAIFKASVDGATNQLFPDGNNQQFIPDLVSGDFDSIKPHVLQHCRDIGCKVVETIDQNLTDFSKCLQLVLGHLEQHKIEVNCIVVLGAFGGRLDHILANLNTLYKAAEVTTIQVYLIGQESLACLLSPGQHRIEANTGLEGEWCGLIPIGQACRKVSTTGLKWNLSNQTLEFGRLISTSNTYEDESRIVTIETEQPILWTMGIKEPLYY